MRKATKIWLIIATFLVFVGCIILGGAVAMLKWDFTKLSTTKYETNEHEITEDYKNVSIVTNTANVVFEISEDEKTLVTCHEQKNLNHSVAVKEGTLVIEVEDTRKWYEHIGIHFEETKIKVRIPKGELGTISVQTSTGNIDAERISVENIDFSVSTGRITVSDVICKGDVKVDVSTGKTTLTNVECENVISKGSTGNVTLKKVIGREKFSIKRSTGDIKLEGCDAAEIMIKTSTGKVTGSLLTDKVFIAKTSTGDIDVPKSTSGGRCEITTSTGDISVTVNP